MSSVAEIAKKINKAWKEDVLTVGSVLPVCPRISTGSLGADYALYGGLPLGNISVYSGLQHSGKTTAACQVMAEYQRQFPDKTCIYIDAEQTLIAQLDFIVKMTGLITDDPNRFLRYDMVGKSAEEMFSDIIELQQADNIGMIIIDSAPALVSQADLDNEFMKDNGLRGSIAKSLAKFIKMMIMYLPKRNNPLLIINQVREVGKTFTGATIYSEPCGHALNYYPSMKVRFGTRAYILDDKELPSNKGEDADGFRLKFSITKSRLGDTRRGGGFLTYRYTTGIDKISDMLEVALKFGFINRPNNIMYELLNLDTGTIYNLEGIGELKFKGKTALFDFLNSHEDFKNSYIEMLNRHINKSEDSKISLLDEETMQEILQQEASIEHNAPLNDPEDDKSEDE